jgi:Lar family restriction alleviation protein
MELRECPFCGHDEHLTIETGDNGWGHVYCNGCDAAGPVKETNAIAIAAWNSRRDRVTVALKRIAVWDFTADECRGIAKAALAGKENADG